MKIRIEFLTEKDIDQLVRDSIAMSRIQSLMSNCIWDSETIELVAETVKQAGRDILDVDPA